MTELGLSERRSCRRVGVARAVQQHRPVPKDDAAVVARMKDLASEYRRYGCPRLQAMLRREGPVVTHKRTRLSKGLQVRSKKRRKLPRRDRIAVQAPDRPMRRWSVAFMSDQPADHRRFRVLNVVDDHCRLCPGAAIVARTDGATMACRRRADLRRTGGPVP